MRAACALFALWLVAGCAPGPPMGPPPASEPAPAPEPRVEPQPEAPAERPTEKPREAAPAVRELVAQARAASAEGRHEAAAARLERALRIDPKSAALWQNLAVVRYRQDRYSEAENLAQRSNSLAGNEPQLRRRNWELIAAVRRLRGDEDGAREAAARASGGR